MDQQIKYGGAGLGNKAKIRIDQRIEYGSAGAKYGQ
jgi:hypothetical protein